MDITSIRLKQLRQRRGLSLEQASNIVGVAKSTMLRWEQGYVGRVSKGNIKVLADYYGVNPLWLLGLVDSEKPQPSHEDALEQEIIRLFKKCDNTQKIKFYNSVKALTDEWGIE